MEELPAFHKLLESKDIDAAKAMLKGAWFTKNETFQKDLDVLVTYNVDSAKKTSNENTALANQTSTIMIIVLIIGVLLAIILGLLIASNIQGIIKSIIVQVNGLVNAAVDGKLDTRAKTEETNEEFREITVGINKTLDAVIKNFEIIGEAANRLSEDFKDSHSQINWTQIRGFCNRIVHDYMGIDFKIVWTIIEKDLNNLAEDIRKLSP